MVFNCLSFHGVILDIRIKMGDDQQDEQGPPPGWGSTPEQKSQVHSRQPSPIVPSGKSLSHQYMIDFK